jgi:hypothetical protein
MGTVRFLWEFSAFYGNLKKACPIVKGYVFSNKWELSDFYRNFPLFMGILRKPAPLSKDSCSAIKRSFPIFIAIFRFLWEFEKSLPDCQRLRVE